MILKIKIIIKLLDEDGKVCDEIIELTTINTKHITILSQSINLNGKEVFYITFGEKHSFETIREDFEKLEKIFYKENTNFFRRILIFFQKKNNNYRLLTTNLNDNELIESEIK